MACDVARRTQKLEGGTTDLIRTMATRRCNLLPKGICAKSGYARGSSGIDIFVRVRLQCVRPQGSVVMMRILSLERKGTMSTPLTQKAQSRGECKGIRDWPCPWGSDRHLPSCTCFRLHTSPSGWSLGSWKAGAIRSLLFKVRDGFLLHLL